MVSKIHKPVPDADFKSFAECTAPPEGKKAAWRSVINGRIALESSGDS
jgi:hypothetical protein